MKELMGIKETMSSLQIAEVTGKQHSNIMRDIRNILEQGVGKFNFELADYIDKQGKQRTCYNLTKKGCLILASGYSALLREKIIDRWEQLEIKHKQDSQIPQSFAEALQLAADQAKQIEQQQKEIEQNKPKVLFADAVTASANCILIGELATILKQNGVEIGQNRLFKYLRENSYLCSHGERYNMPTQKALDLGLFEVKKTAINNPNGSVLVTSTTKVTGKGQVYFMDKFSKLFCHESK